MATVTLIVTPYASAPQTIGGLPLLDNIGNFTLTGSADAGVCIQNLNDGEYITTITNSGGSYMAIPFSNNAAISPSATINSVQLIVNHRATGTAIGLGSPSGFLYSTNSLPAYIPLVQGTLLSSNSLVQWNSAVMTINPATGLAWTPQNIYTGADPTYSNYGYIVLNVDANAGGNNYILDYAGLVITYTNPPKSPTAASINGVLSTPSAPAGPIPTNYGSVVTMASGVGIVTALAQAAFITGGSTAYNTTYQQYYPIYTSYTPINFTQITALYIQYTDNNGVVQQLTPTIFTFQPETYQFIMPVLFNVNLADPVTIVATGTFPVDAAPGTFFTGTVILGTLTVTIANGAGIYVITPGQYYDTMYVNSEVNNTTANVAIPNPFAKTGFLP